MYSRNYATTKAENSQKSNANPVHVILTIKGKITAINRSTYNKKGVSRMKDISLILASAPMLIPLLQEHFQGGMLFIALVAVIVWAACLNKKS